MEEWARSVGCDAQCKLQWRLNYVSIFIRISIIFVHNMVRNDHGI